MKKCPYCSEMVENDIKFCPNCGANLQYFVDEMDEDDEPETIVVGSDDIVRCPHCGSSNVHFVSKEVGEDFDAGDACCGYAICGPIGLLFGIKNERHTETVRKCMKCGHEW